MLKDKTLLFLKAVSDGCQEGINTQITNKEELEAFRLRFLGTKGLIKEIAFKIKEVPAEDRKECGAFLREFKEIAEAHYELKKTMVQNGL